MFVPDLAFYLRSLRVGKRFVASGLIVGASVGFLLGALLSDAESNASQSIRIDTAAISPATAGLESVTGLPLPDRSVLDEAATVRLLSQQAEPDGDYSILVTPNEEAGAIEISVASDSAHRSLDELTRLIDQYRRDRVDEDNERITLAIEAINSQRESTLIALESVDDEIAQVSADSIVLAELLALQRVQLAQQFELAGAAATYLSEFAAVQTGGVTVIGEPETTTRPRWKDGLTLSVAFGIIGAVAVALALLTRRATSRTIESSEDLALFSGLVSIGDVANLDSATLRRLGMLSSSDEPRRGRIIITESLVGAASTRLFETLGTHHVDAEVRSCLQLTQVEATDRVVVAVDRHADTEHSLTDVVELLADAVPRPILAVLC
ncbi:MAG: hypothetical protein K8R99_12240 [Actinomycetia bacterium]|nr:hypothetical protein [Actinomycetes bacterium]